VGGKGGRGADSLISGGKNKGRGKKRKKERNGGEKKKNWGGEDRKKERIVVEYWGGPGPKGGAELLFRAGRVVPDHAQNPVGGETYKRTFGK